MLDECRTGVDRAWEELARAVKSKDMFAIETALSDVEIAKENLAIARKQAADSLLPERTYIVHVGKPAVVYREIRTKARTSQEAVNNVLAHIQDPDIAADLSLTGYDRVEEGSILPDDPSMVIYAEQM